MEVLLRLGKTPLDTLLNIPLLLYKTSQGEKVDLIVFKCRLDEFSVPRQLWRFLMFYKMKIMMSSVTWKRPFPWLPMASCSDLRRVDSFSELFPKKLQINPRIVMKSCPTSRIRNFSEINEYSQHHWQIFFISIQFSAWTRHCSLPFCWMGLMLCEVFRKTA